MKLQFEKLLPLMKTIFFAHHHPCSDPKKRRKEASESTEDDTGTDSKGKLKQISIISTSMNLAEKLFFFFCIGTTHKINISSPNEMNSSIPLKENLNIHVLH